ncbi:c-type cytochrome [Bradyrhizobium sp.]|jgi:cytochrome c|uniref:c-type cytochrome n=1 Tax=Bradyrhizobium sp. TaxID=376 RepID=UPI003C43D8CD
MKGSIFVAVALAGVTLSFSAYAAGDAAAGKSVFNKCAICHSPAPGKNGVGPTLFGVVGRKSASVDGFSYSDAMKAANKTWDEATLDAYLTDPKAMVPGTKMVFPGLPKPEDRANVIAYLETLK